MKKAELIILGIIILSFAVGIYFYPRMPLQMVSHWNLRGEPDGFILNFWGSFLMPIISLVMLLLFILIPRIDPLKANIEKFRKYFDRFIVLIILFLFYIYLLTIFWNTGARFNMGQLMLPAIAIIYYYAGVLITNAKRNYFIGIRTPWTLNNDAVWDKTHRAGGKLFKAAAVIAFLGIFFPNYAFFFVIIPVISVSIYTILYSYFEYRKEMKLSNKQ